MNVTGHTACCLETQTVASTIPCFQSIKHCTQYLASHIHKPISYPSTSYYRSNFIRLIWIGNQVEDYITHNCLECRQDAYHARIINRRRSFLVIIHTLLDVSVYWELHIQPDLSSDFTDG